MERTQAVPEPDGEPDLVLRFPQSECDTTVALAEPLQPFGDVVVDVLVRVDAPGLRVRHSVRTIAGDGLQRFLAGLDADFRGWSGERSWQSLEGDLGIVATHHGRHVQLRLTVQPDRQPGSDATAGWTVTVRLAVLPGEELHRLAREADAFFSTVVGRSADGR